MSSVLDVPIGLIMALALAVAPDSGEGQLASRNQSGSEPAGAIRASNVTQDAADPFRFGEQNWLRAVKDQGQAIGLGALARRVFKTSSGRYYVPDAIEHKLIMVLRADIVVAGQVLHRTATADAAMFQTSVGRLPAMHELLAAHLLGCESALKLAQLALKEPMMPAASAMPALALAYPALFFVGTRPRSAYEVTIELVAAARGEVRPAPVVASRGDRAIPAAALRGDQLSQIARRQAGGSMAAIAPAARTQR